MTRRRFLRTAGATLALASLPLGANQLEAAEPQKDFGGPTPNADFYVTSSGGTPMVDARAWRLKIHGLVRRPLTLSYADVKRLPVIKQTLTLECISNPPDGSAISNAEWVGTPLRPLLDQAGVKPSAVYAVVRAADGYATGLPVAELVRSENFMPYLMNGVPLPPVHGYPVRLFIPGKYGMKQPKWLTEIEFVDQKFIGYWEARGWSNEAWRKVSSGFFYPKPRGGILDILSLSTAARIAGPVTIVGWALAGPRGIRRVQVSTDDGTQWRDAELSANQSPYLWTIWKYHFVPNRTGSYTVRVRATAGDGAVQPDRDPQTGSGMSGQPRMRLEVTAL